MSPRKRPKAIPWHKLQIGTMYHLKIRGIGYFVKYVSQDRTEIKVRNELLGTMNFNKSSEPRFYETEHIGYES